MKTFEEFLNEVTNVAVIASTMKKSGNTSVDYKPSKELTFKVAGIKYSLSNSVNDEEMKFIKQEITMLKTHRPTYVKSGSSFDYKYDGKFVSKVTII